MDGRFENESNPLIQRYALKFSPNGLVLLGERYRFLIEENRYDL
jgi:hypothetical protein